MTFVKINEKFYPATIIGRIADNEWDNRNSKSIKLEMTYAEAAVLFVDGLVWAIVQREEIPAYKKDENGNYVLDENGNRIRVGMETAETEFDNSDYNLAGDITDHRDGTITVKMGKLTELEEAYELMLGDVENEPIPEVEGENEPTPEETEPSEVEGENTENVLEGENEPIPEETEIPEVEGENEPVPEDTEIPEVEGENEPVPEGEEIPEPIPEDTEVIEGEDNENTIDGDITEGGIE